MHKQIGDVEGSLKVADSVLVDSEGIFVPSDSEVCRSFENESLLQLARELIPDIFNLQLLSNSRELASLSHAEFTAGEYVGILINKIQEHLSVLSESTQNRYLKEYLVKLSSDFPYLIQPDSDSETAYGELIEHAEPGQLIFRLGFLHDYNYENDSIGKSSDRRDLVFLVTKIVSNHDVPLGFTLALEKFFGIENSTRIIIVEEEVIFFGATQNDRVRSTGVVPSGSSHLISRQGGGHYVVVRRYTNTGKERVKTAVLVKDQIFNENFLISNGLDSMESREIEEFLSRGQYFDLITHEMTEGIGTNKFSGSNRPYQECLYSVLGISTLASLINNGQINENDLSATRIYILTKICTILSSDNSGVYIPGFALMYDGLRKKNAIEFDKNGFIESVDWKLFDEVMLEIANEINTLLSLDPNPIINIDNYSDRVRADPFIKSLRDRVSQTSQ